MRRLAVLASLTLVSSTFAPHTAMAGLVTCGQTSEGTTVLGESCTGDILMHGGRLDLAGHTVRGTIACDADLCEVVSTARGGTVAGFGVALSVGIVAGGGAEEASGDLRIDGVTIQGFGTGVSARNIVLTNVRLVGNLWRGAEALDNIEAVDTVVRRNGDVGLHARQGGVALDGADVSNNGGSGVRALEGAVLVESTVGGNVRDGVENYSEPALVIDSEVKSNGRHGVRSDDSDCNPRDVLELRGSAVTGNGTDASCATEACGDLVACSRPAVDERSSCDRSLQMKPEAPGEGWAVCEGDAR
jgi:hypothetical protein